MGFADGVYCPMNIYCPNCENECSEAAIACPKCGHPLTASAIPISGTLTTCPNCEAACSAVAVTCPKCGQALAACPNCEAPCNETAGTCTRCGHPLAAPNILLPGLITEPVPHPLVEYIKKSPPPAPRAMDPLKWTVGGLCVLGVFIWCGVLLVSDGRRHPMSGNESSAHAITRQFVEDILVSPATADWPWQAKEINYLGEGRYRVRTYVDSQNRFGAVIRSDVDAVVKWTTGDTWKLESLSVE